MEMAIWLLVGSVLGWAGFAWVGLSADWGVWISVLIGAAGSFAGGELLGPIIGSATAQAGDLDPFLVFMALACAAGSLIVGNMIHNRARS